MVKKAFFEELSPAEIRRGDRVKISRISDIRGLEEHQYAVVEPLIPSGYEDARKFMKHAPEVWPKRQYTMDQAIRQAITPIKLREVAFDSIKGPYFCGYTFLPLGRDKRKRKVSLIECMEGARIFAYSNQVRGAGIIITPYTDARRVRQEGAEIICEVPSRTEGKPRNRFKLSSVPVIDSPEKYAIAPNIGSDHSCPSKRFNIRYMYSDDKESSGIVNLCAHEVAGYLGIINHFWKNEKNMIPLQMSQFAIPSQIAVNFYLNLENNVLVEDQTIKAKDKLRKMNRGEKEISMWSLVKDLGHDQTFFSVKSRDGDVGDYKWAR